MATPRKLREPKSPFPEQHQIKPGKESALTPLPRFKAPHYKDAGKLRNKVALITGGDSGIGRAVAYLFAREGARIALTYLPEELADALATKKYIERAGGRCMIVEADLQHSDVCTSTVQQVIGKFKRIDILVNNAANQQHQDSIDQLTDMQIELTFRVNIMSYMYMSRACIPYMKPGSAIINTGSITAFQGSGELLDYSATKGAIHTFTKSLALSIIDKGIRVNCVAPGPVWTPLNPSDRPAEDVAVFGMDYPMKRPAQPEEIAPAYVFLASEADSSYINGAILPITGGRAVG